MDIYHCSPLKKINVFLNLDVDNFQLVVVVDYKLFVVVFPPDSLVVVAHLIAQVPLQALCSTNIHYVFHDYTRDHACMKTMDRSLNHSIVAQSLMMIDPPLNYNIIFQSLRIDGILNHNMSFQMPLSIKSRVITVAFPDSRCGSDIGRRISASTEPLLLEV
uniref:Uncharacterized protein n=1 Tax=Cucumis melo TaxID=3656 RepID=A0A9I9ED28_CUCME